MKRILFKVTFVAADGQPDAGVITRTEVIAIWARTLNTGWPKAAARAGRVRLPGEVIHAIEWQEIS